MWTCSTCDASTPKDCKCKASPSFEPVEKFDEDRGKYIEHMLPQGGMTLRDYFAAKAMQGGLAGRALNANKPDCFAAECYALADAMLQERAK